MATYTVEVRTICEQMYLNRNPTTSLDELHDMLPQEIVNAVGQDVINFDFPIWDEAARPRLIHKILIRYYMREIALETVPLWKLKMYDKLNAIMPYYIRLYNSEMDAGNLWETVREHVQDLKQGTNAKYGKGSENEMVKEYTTDTATENRKTDDKRQDDYYGFNTKSGYHDGQEDEDTSGNAYGFDTSSQAAKDKIDRSNTEKTGASGKSSTLESGDGTTNTLNASNENTGKDQRYSDTPQNGLAQVAEGKYLTNATVDNAVGSKKDNTIASSQSNAKGESSQSSESTTDGSSEETAKHDMEQSSQRVDSTSGSREKDQSGQEIGTDQSVASHAITDTGIADIEKQGTGLRDIGRDTSRKNSEHGAFDESDNIFRHGWSGDKMDALDKYRRLILNIEEMIVRDLRYLFFGVL